MFIYACDGVYSPVVVADPKPPNPFRLWYKINKKNPYKQIIWIKN